MKIRTIISSATMVAALAGVPLLAPSLQAGPMLGQVSIQFGRDRDERPPPPRYQPSWSEDQRRELRHIFFRLEHANRDYDGHRASAMREIREAAEAMGFDLHGAGYAAQWQGSPTYGGYGEGQSQEWSDNVLRRSRDRLSELANTTEQPVRHELYEAVRELDRALEVR